MASPLSKVNNTPRINKKINSATPAEIIEEHLAKQDAAQLGARLNFPAHGIPAPPTSAYPVEPKLEYAGEQRRTDDTFTKQVQAAVNDPDSSYLTFDATGGTPDYPDKRHPFIWDLRSEAVMRLLVNGQTSISDISQQLDLPINTISAWRAHPDFQQRLYTIISSIGEEEYGHPLATRIGRARAAIKLVSDLQQIQEERAISATPSAYADSRNEPDFLFDQELSQAPGGRTGLVQKRYRIIGNGPTAEKVIDFVTDIPLVNTIIAAQQHAARELGQYVEKAETTINRKLYIGIDIDQM